MAQSEPETAAQQDGGDLTDLLGELRVLLPTAQLLSAFLTTVPFTQGFSGIVSIEKYVFLATFILSVSSLVLLSAPAVQHRLMRPLPNREAFKHLATRLILAGSITLAAALVLVTQLILSEVLGKRIGLVVATFMAILIVGVWVVLPKWWRKSGKL